MSDIEIKTLKLTLHKKAFEVMVTGEKEIEIRKDSEWVRSRLYNKDGSRKLYHFVEFTNGYGKNKPRFTAFFNDFFIANNISFQRYSNELEVPVFRGDFVILLGGVVAIENYHCAIHQKPNTNG